VFSKLFRICSANVSLKMFGFFSSKKKKDEARRMEKADSFYEEELSDDINNDYEQKGMNDDEYRRRVTEEIAKRKSIARGGKVKPPTPTAASTTAHRPMSINPKAAPTPASTKTTSVTPPQSGQVQSGMKAAPSASGTVVPLGRPPAAASSRPPASAPAVVAGAVSSSKSAPPSTTSSNAHRPNPSTTSAPVTPASATSKTSSSAAKPFVPDPKAIQQLVALGFSYPASAYALKIKNNKANMAADFLLQSSEAEIKALLAADAAQNPSATKPTSTTPSSTSATALHTATTTGTSSPKSSSPTPGATPADSGAAKINPVDAAMAAILAKREALKKKQAAEKLQKTVSKKLLSSKSKTLTPTETAATSEPVNAAVYDRLSNYKTKGVSACEAQEEEDKQRGDAQERRRKALSRTPSTRSPERVTSAESSVLGTPPRGGGSPLKRAGSQRDSLYNKKTESMLLKEKQDEEDRAKKEAHDRKWKKMTSPVGAGGHTSESEPEVFDKLYSKKLESHEIAEKVKDEEKARLEKLEAHISGRAGAALPAPDASALLRKTKSAATREQLTAEEKQRFEEEERRERERHPTPRESSSRRGSFSSRCSASLERGHSQSLGERRESIGEAAMRHSSGRGGGGRARGSSLDDVQATQVDDDDDDVTKEDDDDGSITDVDEAGISSVPVSALTTPPGSALNSARQTGASAGDRRSSFREMRSTSISSMGSSHADHAAVSSTTIPGLIPRSVMNFSVKETQDHRWEGKVCTLTKEGKNMLTVKGCYGDKTECIAVTSAYAHPVYAVPEKKSFCRICEEAFNKYLKAENCQNCGQLVCGDCSAESWPQAMVPESFNDKKTDFVRVCAACNTAMERFANTLKSGDFAAVITHYNEGNVNLHHPFLTLPDSPYAIHCAAASGNVKVLEWLVEEKFCSWKDAATGKPLVNASGLTVLAIASRRGDREMMRYAAQQMHCSVADITDIAVLQRGLHAALEAPGALPSLTLKKTASPMATSASFRRYEKMSAPTEEPQIPTDSLFQQAAELAQRLKSTPSMQRMPSKGSSIVSPSQLHPPSGGATSQEAHASTKSAVPLPSTVSEASPSKPPMASSPQRAKSWKQPIVPALPGMETSPPPSPAKVVVPAAAVAAAVVTATVAAAGAVVETGSEREEAAAAAGAVDVPDDLTVKTESEPDQEAEVEHNKEDVAQSNEPATPTVLSVADVISTDAAADEATEKTESTAQQEEVATPTVPALADVLKMADVKDAEKKEPHRQQQEPETEAPDAEDASLWVAVADTLGALQLSAGNSAPADVDKANDDQDVSKQEGKEVEEVTPAPEISPTPTSTTTIVAASAAASAAVDANTTNGTVPTDTTDAAVEVAGTAATEEPTPKKSKSKKSKKSKSKSTP